MKKLIFWIPLIVAQVLTVAEVDSSKLVHDYLSVWKKEIIAKSDIGAMVLNSKEYNELVEAGAGILPEIFEAYRIEQNPLVLYHMRILIGRVGHFQPFLYSTEPMLVGNRQMQYEGSKPFLTERIGPGTGKSLESASETRHLLVQWWDRRDVFLDRADAISEIRAVTGETKEDYTSISTEDAREFERFLVYGVYNLPVLVDLISEDNNPVAFVEFLRTSSHELYQTLEMTGDLIGNAARVTEVYPTAEDKLDIVCVWWSTERGKYAGLEPLQKAIDDSVNTLCKNAK